MQSGFGTTIEREEHLIKHNEDGYRHITTKYTVKIITENLHYLLFASDDFLADLKIYDRNNDILSIMPRDRILILLHKIYGNIAQTENLTIDQFTSKIITEESYPIFIQVPSGTELHVDEIITLIFEYADDLKYDKNEKTFELEMQDKPHSIYYTLQSPNDFEFEDTSPHRLDTNSNGSLSKLFENMTILKRPNTHIFGIRSHKGKNLSISYSFKPTKKATIASRMGMTILSLVGIGYIISELIFETIHKNGLFDKGVEVGILIIAGSLILPQLTANDSFRSRYAKWHLISAAIGGVVMALGQIASNTPWPFG